jgi:CubicO group peptidase (beta-lactamase class C family)
MTAMSGKESTMFRIIFTAFVRLSVVVICLMLTSCRVPSISTTPSLTLTPEDLSSRIDHLMGSLTKEESFTGAVLVARNGEILLSQGYGWADWEKQLSNTSQTRFRLGSVYQAIYSDGNLDLTG